MADGFPLSGGLVTHPDGTIRYAMEVIAFFNAIREAWCAETSADRHWNPELPALGQCAVTALVVQDAFGGDLLRSTICDTSHYWNRLPWESGYGEIDLTRSQFAASAPLDEPPVVRSRDYVLSFPDTKRRYELLRKRVGL